MLEKSKVYLPSVIREQMLMNNFLMMKVFLSATATGMAVMAVLERNGHVRHVKVQFEIAKKSLFTSKGFCNWTWMAKGTWRQFDWLIIRCDTH